MATTNLFGALSLEATQQTLLTALNAVKTAVEALNTKTTAVNTGAVTVSNLPATQAISAESLPLPSGAASEETQSSVANHLARILNAMTDPPAFDAALNRLRVSAAVESGTITTVTTVTTVTTCSTVANVTAIDGMQGRLLPWGQDEAAWHELVRSKIT